MIAQSRIAEDKHFNENEASENAENLLSPYHEESDEPVAECGCPCGRHWHYLEEDVAMNEIKRGAEPCCLIACLKIPNNWYGRHSIHGIYLICTLIFFLFLLISLYMWTIMCAECIRTLNFESSNCQIMNMTMNKTFVCGCKLLHQGRDSVCTENQCAKIVVTYDVKGDTHIISTLQETVEDSSPLVIICVLII